MLPVPKSIADLAKCHRVVLSAKARHQLDAGNFDTDDLTHSILHGKVSKKERDEQKKSQYKYTIIGPSGSGVPIYSCGKIVRFLEKNYFIITFHEAR